MSEPILPRGWPRPAGYSNAIAAAGRLVALAGQVGWDPMTGRFASDDLVEQTRQALKNVADVLKAAGAKPEHVVRLNWFVVSREEYDARREGIGRAYRDVFGAHYPAMTLVIAGLLEPGARVEIEATAVVP